MTQAEKSENVIARPCIRDTQALALNFKADSHQATPLQHMQRSLATIVQAVTCLQQE
jgi:hypothetical protein